MKKKKKKKKKKNEKGGDINFLFGEKSFWGCGHVRQMLGRRCINK
jgi:hypothetical protein